MIQSDLDTRYQYLSTSGLVGVPLNPAGEKTGPMQAGNPRDILSRSNKFAARMRTTSGRHCTSCLKALE